MQIQTNDRVILTKSIMILSALGIVLFFYFSDPDTDRIGIPCVLHKISGWQCWGCGGQRAFHQLLHGNFREAMNFNVLCFPVTALMGYVFAAELSRRPSAYTFLHKRSIQIGTLATLLSFTILRNLV